MYSAPMILNKDNPETIPTLVEILKEGGTAVLPCDTIYGLSAIYGAGEGALRALKGRSETTPFLVIATMDQAKELIPETPQEILDADLAFIDAIGLKEHLSPTRSNGLTSMVKQMKMYALAYKVSGKC